MQFLGKEIELKKLTIGDILIYQKKDLNDFNTVIEMVSKTTGISEEEIKNADLKYLDDIEKVTKELLGK